MREGSHLHTIRPMRILSFAAFALAGATGLFAQTVMPAPAERALVQDLRIESRELGIDRSVLAAQSRDGRLLVAPHLAGGGSIRAIDSAGKILPWSVRLGGKDADILFPLHLGVIAGTSTAWIDDPGFRQVALLDAAGHVVKSIESSTWIHPHWSDRRAFPVFSRMEAVAVYPDTTMLIVPQRPRSLLDTPGYDRSIPRLLRISWGGTIQRSVAMLPPEQAHIILAAKNCDQNLFLPYVPRPTWAVSADGKRIVVVSPGVSPADSGTVRVVALDERGDTVFAKRIAQPAVRVPQTGVDSLLNRMHPCGPITAEQVRDSVRRRMTAFRSFVTGVLVGRDYSTWITMRAVADTSHETSAVALDADGSAVASVRLPGDESFFAADLQHVWATENGPRRSINALVRYKVSATAAPPAHTGRASASSTQPRRPE